MTRVIDDLPYDMSLDAEALYMREVKWLVLDQLPETELTRLVDCLVQAGFEREKAYPNEGILQAAVEARNALVEHFQPFVVTIAGRYFRYFLHLEFLDLVQECNVALLRCLDTFSAKDLGCSFASYLATRAKDAIIHALRNLDGLVRVHWRKLAALKQLGLVEAQLHASLQRQPTLEEVATAMKIGRVKVLELLELRQLVQVTSLQGLMREDLGEDRYRFASIFEDGLQAETSDRQQRDQIIHQVIEQVLTPRERRLVQLRYGFEDGSLDSCKQAAVAAALGISRRRVGQLEQIICGRLRVLLAPLYDDEEAV